jgi:phage RecT family recombinase
MGQQQGQQGKDSWAEKKKREAADRRERLKQLETYLSNPNVRRRLEEKIPGGTITFQVLLASALLSCTKIRSLLNCTKESIFLALLDAAELGLTVHWGPRGEAVLVPFGEKCTLVIGYRGYAKLLYRTGIVRDVQADFVCERDVWAMRRTHQGVEFDHRFGFTGRGKMIGTYAVAYLKEQYAGEGGGCIIAPMDLGKIHKIRDQVLARVQADPKHWSNPKTREQKIAEHPWTVWETEMGVKSAVRQLPKLFPTVDALGKDIVGRAVEIDTRHERERGEHGEAPATAAERAVPRNALPPDTALDFSIPEAGEEDFDHADLEYEEAPPPEAQEVTPPANTNQPGEKVSPVAVPRTDSGRAATFSAPPRAPSLAEVFQDTNDDLERAAIQEESRPTVPEKGTPALGDWLIRELQTAPDRKRLGQLSHDFGPTDYPPEYREAVGKAFTERRAWLVAEEKRIAAEKK